MKKFLKCYPKTILFHWFTDTQTKDNISAMQQQKKNFMTPFYGWGSTASRLEPI